MIYKTIEKLRPHFMSLREIDGNVSLDMKFPLKWKFDYQNESIKIMVQDKNEKVNLVSFVTQANPEGYELVFAAVEKIIQFNLELEEKEKLFQQKMAELKSLFASESLSTLQHIEFNKIDHPEDEPFIDHNTDDDDDDDDDDDIPETTDNTFKLEENDENAGQKDISGS